MRHVMTILASSRMYLSDPEPSSAPSHSGQYGWKEAVYMSIFLRISLMKEFKKLTNYLKAMSQKEPQITNNPYLMKRPVTKSNAIPLGKRKHTPPHMDIKQDPDSDQGYHSDQSITTMASGDSRIIKSINNDQGGGGNKPPKGPTYNTAPEGGNGPGPNPGITVSPSPKPPFRGNSIERSVENNPYIFTDPPPSDGTESQIKGASIDRRIKMDSLPKFDGTEERLLPYILEVNEMANQSRAVWLELGTSLPLRFTDKGQEWWRILPYSVRMEANTDWGHLRKIISQNWMTPTWRSKQRIKADKIHFRDRDFPEEDPTRYILRKYQALQIARTNPNEEDICAEILEHGRMSWFKYIPESERTSIDTLYKAIQTHETSLLNEENTQKKIKNLERAVQNTPNHSSHRTARTHAVEFPRNNKGKFLPRNKPIGSHPKFEKPPFPKDDNTKTKRKQSPKDVGGRGCRHCGSAEHWDDECRYKNSTRTAKVNFLEADQDLLQAIQEYEDIKPLSDYEDTPESDKEEESESSGNEEALA